MGQFSLLGRHAGMFSARSANRPIFYEQSAQASFPARRGSGVKHGASAPGKQPSQPLGVPEGRRQLRLWRLHACVLAFGFWALRYAKSPLDNTLPTGLPAPQRGQGINPCFFGASGRWGGAFLALKHQALYPLPRA
jgi:hypothetical protein